MNLLYAEVIDIFDRDKIRMARIRAKGALKDIPLLADAGRGDTVLVCDGVAIGKVAHPIENAKAL